MHTIVSGIRPTGNLHVGNYFGAVINFLKLQNEEKCYFFIADWHSLTTAPHPKDIIANDYTILAEYLACGLDPEKCTIYMQSDVHQTLELYLYLNMLAYMGELERTTTFKDKVRLQPDNVNAGLLTYPTLMAADILQHRAWGVPVGKDQEQTMEMARIYAKRFNSTYGVDFFPLPKSLASNGDSAVKIPGLDGSGKMGKSEGNALYLRDDEKTIRKKVMKAVTDAGPQEPHSEMPEVIRNLFTFLEIVSDKETNDFYRAAWDNCSIRYGDLKKQIAEDLNAFIAPIRERIEEYSSDRAYLERVATAGAERAHESAEAPLREIRSIVGFPPYRG